MVFPPRCEVCSRSGNEPLCADCLKKIKFMKPHLGIYSVSTYDGVLRDAIHRFKFNRRKKLAEALGMLMVQYIGQTQALNLKEIDAIVPVPLCRKRMRERGFNQAELLARTINRYYEVPVIPVLERVKETKPQFDLNRQARFKNMAGAFRVREPAMLADKRVLLLDDIYTTGATIAECSRALKWARAKRIEVLTLSRAVV